jgi:predicted DCC family thiol-disulfide oxidoreductase YuxK
MATEPKLEIYLDGSCAFCQWSRARIEPWDTRGRLRFLDYNDPKLAGQAPYTLEELASEMHVREPDGTWTAGFAAWLRILRVLPRLAWLGWMLGLPPLRWIGPSAYGWVARHRQLLPGAPRPCAVNPSKVQALKEPAACGSKTAAPGRRAS